MTPAQLVHAIRTAPTDDAAAELLAEHERQLVAVFEADKAAAVALARQSVAAEYDALIDGVADAFWREVARSSAVVRATEAAMFRAKHGPNTVEEATLADESFLLFYAAEKG